MFLLTTNFVKNSYIYARFLLIFLETVLNQTRNDFNKNFDIRQSVTEYLR